MLEFYGVGGGAVRLYYYLSVSVPRILCCRQPNIHQNQTKYTWCMMVACCKY